MPTESIWTALPNGRRRTTLMLSVHVAPRLTSLSGQEGVLSDHPAFADWPPPDISFDVVIGGITYSGSAVSIVSTTDPVLWSALFPGNSRVRSHQPVDRGQTSIHTAPLAKVTAFLKDRYSEVAIASPEDHPSITDLLANGFEQIGFHGGIGIERWEQAGNQLAAALASDHVIDTRASSTATFDFFQLEDFFAPLDGDDPAVKDEYTEPVKPPSLDFHDAVQFVNQHPALMRLLGLTFDLEVDTVAAPVTPGAVTVQVVPQAAALSGTTVRRPVTHAVLDPERFDASPRPGTTHITPGWMRFEDANEFEVIKVDADGGGLKAVDLAGNLQSTLLHPTEGTPTDAALPSLRQDGMSVLRLGKAKAVQDTFVNGAANEAALANDTLELYLDDLVRGVRVDVWDSVSIRWRSTMARTGTYALAAGSVVVPVTDEGFLGTTATAKPLSPDLYIPEEVFWWDGWSLAVPRPGQVLDSDPHASQPLIDRPGNPAGLDFDASIRFDVVPGTLPRLRYGVDYRFRARLVDLAGNSRGLDDPDDAHATAAVRFGRFEPLQTPHVLLRVPNGPGESVETVVLRSNFDVDPSPSTAERHIVPPKVGQLMAEVHGMVDKPDPDPSQQTYDLLAALDNATLLNHPDVDPGTSDRNRWYDTDSLEPTWTPDPMLRASALRMLDGPHAGHIETAPVGMPATWPSVTSCRLVIAEGSGAPSYSPTTRALTVRLAKAEIVHARLSGVLDPGDLDSFSLWDWVLDALPPGAQGAALRNELTGLIRAGQHWMFEPYRVLTLVHAVRQPLARPEFPNPVSVSRPPLSTHAVIRGTLHFDRKSTARVDFLATWQEPVDGGPQAPPPVDVGQPGTRTITDQTACTLGIEYDGPGLLPTSLTFQERHEFGDTKHRVVTYRGVATSRFGEYFTSTATFAFPGPGGSAGPLDTGSPALGIVPGSVKLTSTNAGGDVIVLAEGRHFDIDVATAGITFADGPVGELPPPGANVNAVYLVPPVTRETSSAPGPDGAFGPQVVSVPSSARPAAPKLRYVIPTFGWEAGEIVSNGEVVGLTSTRRGNGLRIYLERPWWSSGEGELLGVVLWPPGEQANPPDPEVAAQPAKDSDRRRPFITMWGQDPIFGSRLLPFRFPRISSFPGAVASATGLTLAELGSDAGLPVNVAAHAVGFDPDRDLWYCDVEIAPGPAYCPMVRLALARWQPASISHAALSRVVLADVIQVAPDRFATVLFDDLDDTVVGVSLSGPTHIRTAAQGGSDPGAARVVVEKKQSGLDGGLAWVEVGEPVELTATLLNGVGQWTGEVELPGPRAPGMWRLVIEQYELLAAEPLKKGNQANPFITVPIPTPRLVHTDIVVL
jgi:hypothetical protein